VFLCYLMRNVWSGIRVGYMLVRVCLGHSAIESELEYLQMVFVTDDEFLNAHHGLPLGDHERGDQGAL